MEITPETVAAERCSLVEEAATYAALINEVRTTLGPLFGVEVDSVTPAAFRGEVDVVFADPDRAVNVAGLAYVLRELDVVEDHPGFVVDELLGRQLASTIAGGQPAGLLAEATFHYLDAMHHPEGRTAGEDDLEAAIAAGFQTRLPGWPWQERDHPFDTSA